MAFAEDYGDFFDVDDFADGATFDGAPVNGIFDHEYVEIEGIESKRPVFHCATSDVSAYSRGSAVVVNGSNYSLVTKEPDGTGTSLCILETQ